MQSLTERFMNKVAANPETGCWEWTAYRTPDGYGRIQVGYSRMAHRISYELFKGLIGEGMEVDHLCKVRHCVNPAHLEAVTRRENIARADTGIHNKVKNHCPKGHEYTESNTYNYNGHRHCRKCSSARSTAWKKNSVSTRSPR